jgi:hypothetical protein
MDEQEHSATPEPPDRPGAPEPPQPAVTSPVTAPAAGQPERRRRGETARKALTSRGAGWVVATAMTGAVVALAVVLATASPAVVVRPVGAARSFVFGPPFGGPLCLQVPAKALTPAQIRVHGPASVWVLVPAAGVRAQVPANAQIPARLLAPACLRFPPGRVVQIPAPAGSPRSSSPSPSPSAS